MAYPKKGFFEGNYYLVIFKSMTSLIKEMISNLKISESVLRYMVVNLEGD